MQEQLRHKISFFNFCKTVYLLKCLIMKNFISLQVIRAFEIFVNGGSMTNAKVHQRFHDDKKVEEHCFSILAEGGNFAFWQSPQGKSN